MPADPTAPDPNEPELGPQRRTVAVDEHGLRHAGYVAGAAAFALAHRELYRAAVEESHSVAARILADRARHEDHVDQALARTPAGVPTWREPEHDHPASLTAKAPAPRTGLSVVLAEKPPKFADLR